MSPQVRGDEPDILKSMGQRWTEKFVARRTKLAGASFFWPAMPKAQLRERKERLNHRLLPLLKEQAEGCCSFCGKRPVESEEIEHFRPKGRAEFWALAFAWENLFYCCRKCQKRKGERWHDLLLKPDVPGYRFEDYFQWNFRKGAIEPSATATPEQRRAAQLSICLYNLNDADHCRVRRHERKNRLARPAEPLEDFTYPHYITSEEP